MVTYLWLNSDQITKKPLPEFTENFSKFPSELYLKCSYEEQWNPFLKVTKGDNLIVRIGSLGFSNNLIKRIIESKFNQKILLIGEAPWRKGIKRIYNNLNFFLKIFNKIYTYIKPLTNNRNIFFLGNISAISEHNNKALNLELINFNEKIDKIAVILSEHSRWDLFNPNNLISSFNNLQKFGSLAMQIIGHPNAKFKVAGLKFNKLYGIRSKIVRYFDKLNIIDIYGRSGWKGTKNYNGLINDIWGTLFKYRWCLCIENRNINNYFSEKIFNAILSGCVPIVLGGPYPSDYLPKGSYVDLRNLNYKSIPDYINNEDNYLRHLSIIKKKYNVILKNIHRHYKYTKIINSNEDLIYSE